MHACIVKWHRRTINVVVDRLLHGLAGLERGELLVHQIEVVFGAIEGSAAGHLDVRAVERALVG